MFNSGYKIATVWGIPIRIHISLIIMLLLFARDFGFVTGTLLGLGLAGSIVLHELGHSIVAIRKGCRVRDITLMFIGGAAQMERMPTRPLDEFLMAIAGPAVSLVLGTAGLLAGGYLPLAPLPQVRPLNAVQLLGLINLVLVAFNLLPAFPMDGGRVFRALLSKKMGRVRATFIAARVGKIMAVIFGIYGFFSTPTRWILVAVGFFVFIAAGNEYRMVRMQEAARQGGRGPREAPGPDENGDAGDDQVIISPPPYRRGPASKADVRSENERNRFTGPFG
jgi:Zn-dependent protease